MPTFYKAFRVEDYSKRSLLIDRNFYPKLSRYDQVYPEGITLQGSFFAFTDKEMAVKYAECHGRRIPYAVVVWAVKAESYTLPECVLKIARSEERHFEMYEKARSRLPKSFINIVWNGLWFADMSPLYSVMCFDIKLLNEICSFSRDGELVEWNE